MKIVLPSGGARDIYSSGQLKIGLMVTSNDDDIVKAPANNTRYCICMIIESKE